MGRYWGGGLLFGGRDNRLCCLQFLFFGVWVFYLIFNSHDSNFMLCLQAGDVLGILIFAYS